MEITEEDIQLVQDFDSWAQDNDSCLDTQLSRIYGSNEDGWEGLAKDNPFQFLRALELATDNKHKMR